MMSYHVLERLLALNARVHLHVMGQVWDDARCRMCGWPLGTAPYACQPNACGFRPHPLIPADTPPAYASDLVTAWRVVEHLQQRDWWVSLCYARPVAPDRPVVMAYEVIFRYHGPARSSSWTLNVYVATADTVPEAICLAALKVAETGRLNV